MNGFSAPQEQRRLEALHRYAVLDTPPEESFDSIVRLAAHICETPISLISLVDQARQWFKARIGLDVGETRREVAFCAHAIQGQELCTVPDALADERFRQNPLVTGEPQIRFYAGVPLVTPDGFALGTLCVIDRKPRPRLTAHQRESLELLARETMVQLELRRAVKELADAKHLVENMNSELEAFGAAVAHDMRAPVRQVSGLIELLADECTDKPATADPIARIRVACGHMHDIINALLRLSRASHDALELRSVDLSAMARDIVAELQTGDPERRVEIKIEEGVAVRADQAMMRILLTNLLSNAWKFTRQTRAARIEFGAVRVEQGRTEYYVRDNGVGFDAALAVLPARPFKRHRSEEGVGLGLTLVERIVRRHHGSLRCEGAPEQGATFSFTLGD